MPKAKKTTPKTEEVKDKQLKKGKKDRFVDEITFQGIITENSKIDIPEIQQIKINSKDFEMDMQLPISLIELIMHDFDHSLQEKSELVVMMSRGKIKPDFAMFLGKCIVYDVKEKYFLGSIGGLTIKVTNLSDNIKLFPQNAEINVALFKSLEEIQK
ncbi:MAG: hypothetical protein ACFFCM_21895 [Promethearchaeota archaeon]